MPVRLRLHAAAAVFTFAAALTLTVLGLLTLNGAQAANTQPNCGDTITADTRLDGDLVDCPNNGIVIGADDITLDLNGHRIDGDGTPAAECNPRKEPCDIGVANDRHDGVTVKRGSLRDFGIGVFVVGARDNRVLDVSSKQNEFFGFAFGDVARSRVRDSSEATNIPPEGRRNGRVRLPSPPDRRQRFGTTPWGRASRRGFPRQPDQGNRFSHSSPGILMEGDRIGCGATASHRNRDAGIIVDGSRNVVERNHLSRDGAGISLGKGSHNLVARNVVVDARSRGISLGLDFADGSSIGGVDNIVRRNEVRGSAGDAFLVKRGATTS